MAALLEVKRDCATGGVPRAPRGPPAKNQQRGPRAGGSLSRMTPDPHAIRAVVEGEPSAPFAVLGPHRVQTRDGAAVAVRAIVPAAAAVRVLPADAPPT